MTLDFPPGRISEILLDPAEDLAFEIKEWLSLSENEHKAKLAQAMIALANHGGGTILIGYSQLSNGRFTPASPRPANIDAYSTDNVNNISHAYLSPSVHCVVTPVRHPITGEEYPLISVPGGHPVPIMAAKGGPQDRSTLKSGRVYIRKPGPKSEEPAEPDEWRSLFDRCIRNGRDELLDRFRVIIAGGPPLAPASESEDTLDSWIRASEARWQELLKGLPSGHPARFPLGYYRFAYQLRGQLPKPSLRQLNEMILRSEVHHSGWPHWPVLQRDPISPYPIDDTIECFLAKDNDSQLRAPDTLDYWRVSLEGKAFSVRGLNEDSHTDLQEPGKFLDITRPTWCLADALTHAANLAEQFDLKDGFVDFDLKWSGLAGRQLSSVGNARRCLYRKFKTQQAEYSRPRRSLSGGVIRFNGRAARKSHRAALLSESGRGETCVDNFCFAFEPDRHAGLR